MEIHLIRDTLGDNWWSYERKWEPDCDVVAVVELAQLRLSNVAGVVRVEIGFGDAQSSNARRVKSTTRRVLKFHLTRQPKGE